VLQSIRSSPSWQMPMAGCHYSPSISSSAPVCGCPYYIISDQNFRAKDYTNTFNYSTLTSLPMTHNNLLKNFRAKNCTKIFILSFCCTPKSLQENVLTSAASTLGLAPLWLVPSQLAWFAVYH
jgi:hypothetical protein